jgi:pre-mRNA-processing factor 6
MDRKTSKARNWFNRSVTVNPDLGDSWAMYDSQDLFLVDPAVNAFLLAFRFYKFETEHGKEGKRQALIKRCKEADPRHGEEWCKISKAQNKESMKAEDILLALVDKIESPK